jgi:hypothetical protein
MWGINFYLPMFRVSRPSMQIIHVIRTDETEGWVGSSENVNNKYIENMYDAILL